MLPSFDGLSCRDLPPYVTASSLNLLIRSGIIKPSDPSQTEEQFLKAKQEGVLRTAATVAIHRMCQHLVNTNHHKDVTPVDLSHYLDELAREEDKAMAEQGKKSQPGHKRFVPSRDSSVL